MKKRVRLRHSVYGSLMSRLRRPVTSVNRVSLGTILGSVVLQTSSSTSTQFAVASGPVLLILAWVVCVVLIVVGVATGRSRLVWAGVMAVGVMTIVTPLTYYVSETFRLGVFRASVRDFLLLAGLSALGGGIITIGAVKLASHRIRVDHIAVSSRP